MRTGFSCGLLLLWTIGYTFAAPRFTPIPAVFEASGAASEEAFTARSGQYRVVVGPGAAARFQLGGSPVALELEGSRNARCNAAGRLPSVTRRYGSGPLEAAHYGSVWCREVYAGVDWIWKAADEGVLFELRVAPLADPGRVRIRFRGVRKLRVAADGALIATAPSGQLRFRPPRAFEGKGFRKEVAVGYRVRGTRVRFDLPLRTAGEPLLIDPVITGVSFAGGAGFDAANAMAMDGNGNIYITGETASADFPTPAGNAGSRANRDAFVSKLGPDGRTLLYTTILSGSGNDSGRAIAVDGSGNAYVAGMAAGPGFPVTAGAVRAAHGGLEDAFVARLDPEGRVTYSTYLGDSGTDVATAIAVRNGGVYVAGYTNSSRFPTSSTAPQTKLRSGALDYDSFLAKLNPAAGTLDYSTLFGGYGSDVARAAAVAATGEACFAGRTDSDGLPAAAAFRSTRTGGGDAFLACVNSGGTAWTQVSYLGGTSEDEANALAIDGQGNRHLAGSTFSPDFPGPANTPAPPNRGDYDAFVAVLTPAGVLVRSTLIGGTGTDSGTALFTAPGEDWLAGYTNSPNLGATGNGSAWAGAFDAFFCHLTPDSGVESCSYVGGPADDRAYGIAVQGSAMAIAGLTGSPGFTTPRGLPEAAHPPYDAFVATGSVTMPPFLESVTPASGSGDRQAFTVSVTASAGIESIGQVMLLIRGADSSLPACQAVYARAQGTFFLMDDAGTTLLGGAGSRFISNAQCTLRVQDSAASANGATLAVSFSMQFKNAFAGTRNLYARTTGSAASSDWRLAGTYTVQPVNDPPEVLGAEAGPLTGSAQTFKITVSDPDSEDDAAWVLFLLDRELTGIEACYAVYHRASRLVHLVDDSGAVWLPPIAAGSPSTVSNRQCTLDGASTSASISNGMLAVTLGFRFSRSFAGTKRAYVLAWDQGSVSSNWQEAGSFNVVGTN